MFKELFTESKKTSISLATTKSPVGYVTIQKYRDGKFGILSFEMNGEANVWLVKKQGFKYDRHTNYPYKVYDTREELDNALKNIFGINPRLVESDLEDLKETHGNI